MIFLNYHLTPTILLIVPFIVFVVGFRFYVLKPTKKTEGGLFNVCVEVQSIGDFQTKKVTKYLIHKWCVFKVVKFITYMDYLKVNTNSD